MFRSVLCLNGDLPDRDVIEKFIQNNPIIIAADGAANKLKNTGILPSVIIGDLDSIDKNINFENTEIIEINDQNYTDFEKCIFYIIKHEISPTLVLGVNGGEIDHTIDNINKFIKYSEQIPMIFFDSPNKWGIAIDNDLSIFSKQSSTVSIFPFMPNTHIKSEGLHWELDSKDHSIFKNVSTRNKTTKQIAKITSSQNKVLVIVESNFMPFDFS